MSHPIKRILALRALLCKKSYFLFDPRQTGKTFLLRQNLANVRTYNLLDSSGEVERFQVVLQKATIPFHERRAQ